LSSSSSSATTSAGKTYTRGDLSSLPADDTNLKTTFSASDYTTVTTEDGNRVANPSFRGYSIKLFKDKSVTPIQFTAFWRGRTNLAPSESPVMLQVYNRVSGTWLTVATNNSSPANTTFTLTSFINTNYTDYFDANFEVASRIIQATA
jgi:hypothetical protein